MSASQHPLRHFSDYPINDLPEHKYLPLPDDGEPWIRLLILLPSKSRDDPLECFLVNSRRNDMPYKALSYTWGDPTERMPLVLQGYSIYGAHLQTTSSPGVNSPEVLHITRNLHTALVSLRRRVRGRNEALTLWVDAVCIDQNNLEEKQRQIRLMGSIYSNATTTLIWIGEADERTRELFFVLRVLSPFTRRWELCDRLYRIGTTRSARKTLFELFERPWFHRIWTAQELCLSWRPVIVCGHYAINFSFLVDAIAELQVINKKPPPRIQLQTSFVLTGHRGPTMSNVFNLLASLEHNQATEPKDYIFGILALSEALGVCFPPMSYAMSTEKLQSIATRSWLRYTGKLYLLLVSACTRPGTDLPTWAIDWSDLDLGFLADRLDAFDDARNGQVARATQNSQVDEEILIEVTHNWRAMRVRALVLDLDVVRYIRPKTRVTGLTKESWNPTNRLEYLEFASRWLQFVVEVGEEYGTQAATYHGFIRLLHFIRVKRTGLMIRDPAAVIELFCQTAEVTRKYVKDENPVPKSSREKLAHELGSKNLLLIMYEGRQRRTRDFNTFGKRILGSAAREEFTLFALPSGQLGACFCDQMKVGDTVALLAGSDYPVILRRTKTEGEFRLVGPAYIESLMDGNSWPENAEDLDVITLV